MVVVVLHLVIIAVVSIIISAALLPSPLSPLPSPLSSCCIAVPVLTSCVLFQVKLLESLESMDKETFNVKFSGVLTYTTVSAKSPACMSC